MSFSLNIPGWEQSQLTALSQQNLLSGVPPLDIALIDQAESSGNPGSPNSAGYGGFFGLSPSTQYPGGVVGSGEGSSSQAEFDKEAEIAASEFASLLQQAGGDPIKAEFFYQQGGNAPYPGDAQAAASYEGPGIFASALGPGANASLESGQGLSTTTGNAPASTNNVAQLKGFGAILQSLDNILNMQNTGEVGPVANLLTLGVAQGASDLAGRIFAVVYRGLFTVGFLGVAYFGVKALTGSGGGGGAYPGKSIVDSIQAQQRIGQGNQRIGQTGQRIGQAQDRIIQQADNYALNVTKSRTAASQRQEALRLSERGQEARVSVQNRRAAVAERDAATREARNRRITQKQQQKSQRKGAATEALKTVGEAAILE